MVVIHCGAYYRRASGGVLVSTSGTKIFACSETSLKLSAPPLRPLRFVFPHSKKTAEDAEDAEAQRRTSSGADNSSEEENDRGEQEAMGLLRRDLVIAL